MRLSVKVQLTVTCWLICSSIMAQREGLVNLSEVEEGKRLPDSSFVLSFEGDTVYFHSLKGEWLLIDYWSTSCKPCIKEMPHLRNLESISGLGLRVVMVNTDAKHSKWARGIRNYKPPSPHYQMQRNAANALTALNLISFKKKDGTQKLTTHMPQYVLIAPDGTILDKEMIKPSDSIFIATFKHYQAVFERAN